MSFISFIKEKSRQAGWPAIRVVSETLVTLPFDTDEGAIDVRIQPCGKLEGKTVIEFSSPAIPVPAEGSSRLILLDLLMNRNGNLLQGHWSTTGEDDEKKFSVMVTQIAETMDPPEFKAAVRAVLSEFQNFKAAVRKTSQEDQVDF